MVRKMSNTTRLVDKLILKGFVGKRNLRRAKEKKVKLQNPNSEKVYQYDQAMQRGRRKAYFISLTR